jgi:hypothetical protein
MENGVIAGKCTSGDNIAEQVHRIKDLYIDTKVEDLWLECEAK